MTTPLQLSGTEVELYARISKLPIVSPHGHTDPEWFSQNRPFADPAELIVIPDHYVFRMLYSQGVSLSDLGVGVPASDRNPRAIWDLFAANWHIFLGTPTRLWLEHMFRNEFDLEETLTEDNSGTFYDRIVEALGQQEYLPRALFKKFSLEVLATTDAATDTLIHHRKISADDWDGRVIPTFRPDAVIDPNDPRFQDELGKLEAITDISVDDFDTYLEALRFQRRDFQAVGATATDHAIELLHTEWLDRSAAANLFDKARQGIATHDEAARLHGHMLIEMAQMSCDDGLVMQLHAGSRRNTNADLLKSHGRDMGADIPVRTDWTRGLEPLLARTGTHPNFRLIAFTLDESTYARELAPMAGHWPSMLIGPPWWFHDSLNGILRYFDQVVETAGYQNLAGFNDDTRAFMSIPARHDLWRRAVAIHLAHQMERGLFNRDDAEHLAEDLAVGLARRAYRL